MSSAPLRQSVPKTDLEIVPTAAGFELLIDPRDYLGMLLTRDGIFEAAETDLISRILRPGDTCIDGGCHVGYHSCLMDSLVGEKGRLYAFDANPQACAATRRNLALNGLYSTQVIHAALSDRSDRQSFYVSTDDQTGLSSLAPIPTSKQIISVPSLRLDSFFQEKQINRVRMLKLDVEGAEELVLRGLGDCLSNHVIDFILIECFDERLALLGSSTAAIAQVLRSAGYTCWEFGTNTRAAWSVASDVQSRGDSNFLFSSPHATEQVPTFSLSPILAQTIQKNVQLAEENADWKNQKDHILQDHVRQFDEQNNALKQLREQYSTLNEELEQSRSDNDWLLGQLRALEAELSARGEDKSTRLQELERTWQQVEHSAGWRLLNHWRNLRNRVAGDGTLLRRTYDRVLRPLRG